jgi:ribonuclease D
MEYSYVDTPEALRTLLDRLKGEPLLGVDTEAAGYHRYLDRISLIQVSTRRENVLVDPIALQDLSGFGPILSDPGVEKIFHDADYDLRILHRDLDLQVRGLFDTQIAAAFLGERSLGLGTIIENHLGLKLPKAYQRADWAERPLSEGMLEYAVTDTAHLPELRDRLRAQLEEKGRLAWAEEEFELREATRWSDDHELPPFMRMKGARNLQPRELAVLRELHAWREGVAEARDQATFRVLNNQALFALAAAAPESTGALRSHGVPDRIAQRHGSDIVAAIQRGVAVPEEELPRFPRTRRWDRDPEVEARADRLRAVRDRAADRLELDPGFLMPRATMEAIARRAPTSQAELLEIEGVRRWQVEALGDALLRAGAPS